MMAWSRVGSDHLAPLAGRGRIALGDPGEGDSQRARSVESPPHPSPCNLNFADSARISGAMAGGRPSNLWDTKPVGERGSSPAVPSNPNSRLGRLRSPVAQGWDQMDAIYVGIDVSKDRLDVAVRPGGESFAVSR